MLGIDTRALRAVWTVFLFALVIAILYLIRQTLVVFVLAIFLAHLLEPIVTLVERVALKKRSRAAALGLVYVTLLGLAAAILIPIGSKIGEEASALAARVPEAVQLDPLSSLPLPYWLEDLRPKVNEILRQRVSDLDKMVLPAISQAGQRIIAGLGNILSIILIPILSFFFLKDGAAMYAALLDGVGDRMRMLVADILDGLHGLLSRYIRSVVLLSGAAFVSHSAFFTVIGVPYAILLAGIAGILEFIPVVGPLAAGALILLVSALAGYDHLLWILVFLILYRFFQDYVLSPYLMSTGVEIHPLLVLFGVLAGENAAGIPGMFFSVPLLAALRLVIVKVRRYNADLE
jgi:predicted PurR-regulated permease PerM